MPAPANLVHQQSTTTGTGNFTLTAVNGKQSFATAFGTGVTTDVFDYFISNQSAAEWERGTGHMSASNTLVRDTVKEGTNGTSPVNFSAGTKDISNDRPALEQLRGSQAVNVLEYIPISLHAAIAAYTSTTDVSSYIQAAQNALSATQSLIFPPGIYTVGSTLTKRNSTRWLGACHGGLHGDATGSSSSSDHATIFKWSGSAGGTMIDYAPNGTSSDPVIKGGAITGIALDGNGANKAGIGLSMKSVSHNVIDLFGKQFSTAAFLLGIVAATSESTRNTEHNDITLVGNQVASGDGHFLQCDGSASADANVCFNTFRKVYCLYLNGDAVRLADTDNNLFEKVWAFRFTGGTGVGVRFRANSTAGVARVNTILQCSPGAGGVYAEGTEVTTNPSRQNTIFSYDDENSAPAPVIGTGATLFVRGNFDDLFNGLVPQGRLTLQTGQPVSQTPVTAQTSIYYSPYIGNIVPIYDGARFVPKRFSELTLALDSTSGHTNYHQSGSVFDLFVINDSGTIRLATGPAWTSITTRGTGAGTTELGRLNGILTNANSMTARFGSASGNTVTVAANRATYVGSFRASADGQTEFSFGAVAAGGTRANLYLWNNYHRRPITCFVGDTTDSWTYTTAAWRAANNSSTMKVAILLGLGEDVVEASFGCFMNASGVVAAVGIGIDVTNAVSGRPGVLNSNTGFAVGEYRGGLGQGVHILSAIEYSGGATATFYGDGGSPSTIQNGLSVYMPM